MVATRIAEAAARLIEAEANRTPCAPVRDLIGPADVHAAYAVQEQIIARRVADGARIIGRKIGLTAPAVQHQLGVDQPDFGVLLDGMGYQSGDDISLAELLQPRVEAEIAFALSADLTDGPLDLAQIRGAIGYAVAALEIVDSRIANWDIRFADTVADNGSSARFVLGNQHVPITDIEPADVVMSMNVNGTEASTGNGAACLGDPLIALQWLARISREFGQPLRAGQIVLSGALGSMVSVTAPCRTSATISGLGTVTVNFAK
jgi:2-keto-4-pentenoate hydratase